MTRVVLACSAALVPGSDPTSGSGSGPEAISWLAEQYGAEVVTLMLDFGRGREIEALRDRALAAGAVRAHVLDVANEFAADFVLPALKAGALYLDGRPSGPGLERMVTAQKLVEVAAIEQTTAVAHGYSARTRQFAAAVTALDERLTVIALPESAIGSADGSQDLGSVSTPSRRSEPAFVDLAFVRGAPTAVNGVTMPLTDLLSSINMLAGTHAGHVNHRETAASMLLHDAHRGLQESVTSDQSERRAIGRQYAELIDSGAWFSPARHTLDAAVDRLEEPVSGTVRLRLLNDDCHIVEIGLLDARRKVEVRTSA